MAESTIPADFAVRPAWLRDRVLRLSPEGQRIAKLLGLLKADGSAQSMAPNMLQMWKPAEEADFAVRPAWLRDRVSRLSPEGQRIAKLLGSLKADGSAQSMAPNMLQMWKPAEASAVQSEKFDKLRAEETKPTRAQIDRLLQATEANAVQSEGRGSEADARVAASNG
jgi:hypothetical protein